MGKWGNHHRKAYSFHHLRVGKSLLGLVGPLAVENHSVNGGKNPLQTNDIIEYIMNLQWILRVDDYLLIFFSKIGTWKVYEHPAVKM